MAELNFYDPDIAEAFTDENRKLFCIVRIADPAFDLAQMHLQMTAFHRFIDELRDHLNLHTTGKGRTTAYKISYLTRCFFPCDTLPNAASLKKALYWASRVILPPTAAYVIQRSLDAERSAVPSPSTISRLRGRIDVAWMMVWRKRLKEWLAHGLVVYPGTDSSPQGGRDYHKLLLDVIPRSAMADLQLRIQKLEARSFGE